MQVRRFDDGFGLLLLGLSFLLGFGINLFMSYRWLEDNLDRNRISEFAHDNLSRSRFSKLLLMIFDMMIQGWLVEIFTAVFFKAG